MSNIKNKGLVLLGIIISFACGFTPPTEPTELKTKGLTNPDTLTSNISFTSQYNNPTIGKGANFYRVQVAEGQTFNPANILFDTLQRSVSYPR